MTHNQSSIDEQLLKQVDKLVKEIIDQHSDIVYAYDHETDEPYVSRNKIIALLNSEKQKAVEEATPIKIMGKTIDEVCVIISGLELERITELKMTMANLDRYVKLIKEDLHKATEKALNNAVSSALKQTKPTLTP